MSVNVHTLLFVPYRYAANCQTGSRLFQIKNKRLWFARCRYAAFLLNEAKPVVQRQSVNKWEGEAGWGGAQKKDLSTHVSIVISRGVKKEGDPERRGVEGGRTERKSATVSREGKRSHGRCPYFFPPGRLLWFGEEFWLRLVWSLVQCDPVQMAWFSFSSVSAAHCGDCDRRTAELTAHREDRNTHAHTHKQKPTRLQTTDSSEGETGRNKC